jgi:hypothetical protein
LFDQQVPFMFQAQIACLLLGLVCVIPARVGDRLSGNGLAKPVPVKTEGQPIVRDRGALFPFVGDFDGDSRQDLLLGGLRDGRMLVYRNVGRKANPRLASPQWFDDAVTTGRAPAG